MFKHMSISHPLGGSVLLSVGHVFLTSDLQ